MTTTQHQDLTVERHHSGAWIITALVADGKSCGTFYKTMRYEGYTKQQAIAQYLQQYGNIMAEDEGD